MTVSWDEGVGRHEETSLARPARRLLSTQGMWPKHIDDADTVILGTLVREEVGLETIADPGFGSARPLSLPPNAYTAVMPRDLDEPMALRPLPMPVPKKKTFHIPDEVTRTLCERPSQRQIPTQVFGPATRKARVLPPPEPRRSAAPLLTALLVTVAAFAGALQVL